MGFNDSELISNGTHPANEPLNCFLNLFSPYSRLFVSARGYDPFIPLVSFAVRWMHCERDYRG